MYDATRDGFVLRLKRIGFVLLCSTLATGSPCWSDPPVVVVDNQDFRPANDARLGVIVRDSPGQGVLVTAVDPRSPAEAAGVTSGDFIIAIDGNAIEKPDDLSSLIQSKAVGDQLEIAHWRDGVVSKKKVRLATSATTTPKKGRAWLGVELDSTYLDGARIAAVDPVGPAAQATVRAGDTITAIDHKSIDSATDLVDAMKARQPGDVILATVRRGDIERVYEIELSAWSETPFFSYRMPWPNQGVDSPFSYPADTAWTPGIGPDSYPDQAAPWRQEMDELKEEVQQLRDRIRERFEQEVTPRSEQSDGDV